MLPADLITANLGIIQPSEYEAIFIDEIQFYTGLAAFASYHAGLGTGVVLAGLCSRCTTTNSLFGEVVKLFGCCEEILFLKANCSGCSNKEGIFTRRTDPMSDQLKLLVRV